MFLEMVIAKEQNFLKIQWPLFMNIELKFVTFKAAQPKNKATESSRNIEICLKEYIYDNTIRVIYDRVQNQKNYFEIAAFLNLKRGTSRAENYNENKNTNKHISVAVKCNITLNFPTLDIPRSIGRKAGISK